MALLDPNRHRLVAGVILFVVVGGLALTLRDTNAPWQDTLGQASYDSLQRLSGPAFLTDPPVVVVYLDLASYKAQGLDPLKPWPRVLHAQLLRRLTADGARAVIFDIVFSGVGPRPSEDEAFVSAIAENGRVILAAECNYNTSHVTADTQVRAFSHSTTPPVEPFAHAAAAVGLAIQAIDEDYAVRRYVAGFGDSEPTLTWAAAGWLQLPVTQTARGLEQANRSWIRYYGPPLSIPHVSYAEGLDSAGVPPGFFHNKIVLIGARPWEVAQFHERQDEFGNPYHSESKKLFMPGAEVHATEILNLIRGDSLRRLDPRLEIGLFLLAAALFGGGMVWLRPIQGTFVALAGSGLVLLGATYGFAHNVWFPWLLVSAVEIPCAWAGSVLSHSVEWYRARKRFEAAKRIADAKIAEQAALIEKAHDAILVRDLRGKTLYANPSAEQLFGWTLNELRSEPPALEMFSLDPDLVSAARAAVLKNGEWSGELRQQTRQGRVIIVASRWTLIRDDAGQPKALLMMSTDVTAQKELEAQFLRSQRMNTIGTLAGGMAHDLNNALAPILMGVQLLRRTSGDGEARKLLDLMETSTHRGADMVRQVLLFARGRGGEFERIELTAIVKELERMVRDTFPRNITVEAFLPSDLWRVRANSTQLHQVLLNLCVNARDAMPNGGKLSFAADNVSVTAEEAAQIRGGRSGDFVSLLVSDTGMGMPPEIRAKIFEPFFTTKGEGQGTGIGLSTVLRIVQAHGGFLRVESEPGQGTTFEVFLPRVSEQAAVAEKVTALPGRGNGELILLADDEQAIRDLLTAELTASGYRTIAAPNGAEALTIFREHATEVHLFITDGAMPVMNGLDAVAALRKLAPDLPVILTSGTAEDGEASNLAVVNKPFSFDDLLASIQQEMLKPDRRRS